jgi:hypothetical protein
VCAAASKATIITRTIWLLAHVLILAAVLSTHTDLRAEVNDLHYSTVVPSLLLVLLNFVLYIWVSLSDPGYVVPAEGPTGRRQSASLTSQATNLNSSRSTSTPARPVLPLQLAQGQGAPSSASAGALAAASTGVAAANGGVLPLAGSSPGAARLPAASPSGLSPQPSVSSPAVGARSSLFAPTRERGLLHLLASNSLPPWSHKCPCPCPVCAQPPCWLCSRAHNI